MSTVSIQATNDEHSEEAHSNEKINSNSTLQELFESKECVSICAPMVRYSKLAFRLLVRKWNCDVAFTPMMLADSFSNSKTARFKEFVSCENDRPLIAQFAANDAVLLFNAASYIQNSVDGIDINCGCPQKWAIKDGIGSAMLSKMDLLKDMVDHVSHRLDIPLSVKIRLLTEKRHGHDIRATIDLCRAREAAGASFISVHGRTKFQRSSAPADWDAIATIKESVKIPVIANGDVFQLQDADKVHAQTNVNGVMSARGLLVNPSLFSGTHRAPLACIRDFMQIATDHYTPYALFHKHMMYMMESYLTSCERIEFNALQSNAAIFDYMRKVLPTT